MKTRDAQAKGASDVYPMLPGLYPPPGTSPNFQLLTGIADLGMSIGSSAASLAARDLDSSERDLISSRDGTWKIPYIRP